MRRKRVWRYYCDFCKKANCSSYAISEHEKRCTLNPNRECRMCWQADKQPLPIGDLKTALEKGLEFLRRLTKCPACIMAAIRQSGKSPYNDYDFNWSEESRVYFEYLRQKWEADEARYVMYG